jgi:hypothetical protein
MGTEHLRQEDPERHERREDSVLPGDLDLLDRLGNAFRRQDLSEWQMAFLEELLPEEVDFPTKTSLRGMSHRSCSKQVSAGLADSVSSLKAFFTVSENDSELGEGS